MKTPRLTQAGKRLRIAIDVIAQILSNAFLPTSGQIFQPETSGLWSEELRNESAQKILNQSVKPNAFCGVCAKGALILAHTMRFNVLKVSDLNEMSSNSMSHYLPEFPQRMMAEIETLFEGKVYRWNMKVLSFKQVQCLYAHDKANGLQKMSERERLIHIMGLLIKNQGKAIVLGAPKVETDIAPLVEFDMDYYHL